MACLQELKSTDAAFPADAIRRAGYGAVWHGQRTSNGVAILARDAERVPTRRGLPGDDAELQSRCIEAAVQGVLIGCRYAPNGNPQPGPKFAYKLAWLARLADHAATLLAADVQVVLAGDFNVPPTDADIYATKSWAQDAQLQPASRAALGRLIGQGWTDAIRAKHPTEPVYTFWDYKRDRWPRDAGLRLDHLLLSSPLAGRLIGAGVDRWCAARKARAITRRRGWSCVRDRPLMSPAPAAIVRSRLNTTPGSAKTAAALRNDQALRRPLCVG